MQRQKSTLPVKKYKTSNKKRELHQRKLSEDKKIKYAKSQTKLLFKNTVTHNGITYQANKKVLDAASFRHH